VSGVGYLATWGVPQLVLEVGLPALTRRMRATTRLSRQRRHKAELAYCALVNSQNFGSYALLTAT